VCAVEEFECADSTCIPADRQCDGFADCWDRSDEANCGWYSKLSVYLATYMLFSYTNAVRKLYSDSSLCTTLSALQMTLID